MGDIIPPQRRLTGDAPVEFMETRMRMPEGLAYVQELDRFLPREEAEEQATRVVTLWNATARDRNNLFVAVKRFQDKLSKEEPSLGRVDLRTSNWPEVMKEYHRALRYHEVERTKGVGGAVLTCFRKIGDYADVFSKWLDLLPNGDYGAPICGAFKIILGAAGRMGKIRMFIYEALRDIPEAVSKAQRYMEIYSDVKAYQLSQKTAQLYSAVLNSLENIILSFTESGWKRVGKAMFQGEKYQDQIVQSVAMVRDRAIEINEEAKICAEARQRKMDENLVSGIEEVREVKRRQQNMEEKQQNIERLLLEGYHQLLLSHEDLDRRTRQPYRAIEEDREVKTRKKRKSKSKLPEKEALTVEQLLAFLTYDEDLPKNDLEMCRADGDAMSISGKDNASHIARDDQFRDWLVSDQSRALLIMGNTGPTDLFSPLSFLVAELTAMYVQTEGIFTLTYFCGMHTDEWRNPRANAKGLVNSLVGQLLSYEGTVFDLNFISDEMSGFLQNDDIDTLCNIFKDLVLQIQESVVIFCFIDTISIYETPEREEGTDAVLRTLMDLVNHPGNVVFKLLVTDPGINCKVEGLIEERDVFHVPSYIDGDRQGVFLM